MATARTSGNAQEAIMSRLEALVQAINDREQILSANKSQLDAFERQLETQIQERIGQLETKVDNSLVTAIKSTSDYTAS